MQERMLISAVPLIVQPLLAIVLLSVVMLSAALAAAPDSVKQRFELLNSYQKKPGLVSNPPGGGAKVWTKKDKAAFWYSLDMIYDRAPGLIERAVQYRPIRVYRARNPKFQKLIAMTNTQELFMGDWWFNPRANVTRQRRDILNMQPLAHEMFHLSEPFLSVSYSQEWQAAVASRMQKVRDHFKAKGMGIFEARKTSKTYDEHDLIAHAQGLPYLWAAYAMYEALAESGATMIVQKHIKIAPGMRKILKANFFDRPGKKTPAKVLAHQALSALENGDTKKAVELFSKAEKAGATWGQFYYYRAEMWNANLLVLKDALRNVVRDLSKAIKIMAFDGPQALNRRAEILKRVGQYKLAIKDYSDFLDVHVFMAETVYQRALTYQRMGDLGSALKDFDLLIAREPNSPKTPLAYLSRSRVKLTLKQPDGALQDVERAISLHPKPVPQFYYQRARIWLQKKDTAKALADFSKTIELDADFYDAYHGRGFELIILKRFDDAARDFEAAHKLQPRNVVMIVALAKLVKYKGDTVRADALMRTAREINPALTKKIMGIIKVGDEK